MLSEKFSQEELDVLKKEVTEFLVKLVGIRSYPNEEQEAAQFCYDELCKLEGVEVRKLPMDNSLMDDPLWCPGCLGPNDYTGHFNVEAVWKGTGEQLPVYLNAHLDTVTVSEDDQFLFTPTLDEDGLLHGIGACDDKGSIACIYMVFRLLSKLNVRLPFDVVGHMVCEEEIGGNGALAIARREPTYKGQAAIVLEPTGGGIYPIHRYGLWIKLTCHGTSCHTSALHTGMGVSAFNVFLRAYEVLKAVHDEYREECRRKPAEHYEGYLPPLNVGMVHLGDWPSKCPPKAVCFASVAVLPNLSNEEMKDRIRTAFAADPTLCSNVDIEFPFDRGCSVGKVDSPFIQDLVQCVQAGGYSGNVHPMNALSDMYFYQEMLGIPTVTYGPGDIGYAHSSSERVSVQQVFDCADIIHEWMLKTAKKQQ